MKNIFLISLVLLAGCAHSVHQSHTSDFKEMKPGSKLIESNSEQFAVMGFVNDTAYVEQAFEGLKSQCPNRITGITTRYSTSLGFFSWTNKIHMSGYCVSSKN